MSETLQDVLQSIIDLRTELAALTEAQSSAGFRLDMTDLRLDSLDSQVSAVETAAATVQAPEAAPTASPTNNSDILDGIQADLDHLSSCVGQISEAVSSFGYRLDGFEADLGGIKGRLDRLEREVEESGYKRDALEMRLNILEQKA